MFSSQLYVQGVPQKCPLAVFQPSQTFFVGFEPRPYWLTFNLIGVVEYQIFHMTPVAPLQHRAGAGPNKSSSSQFLELRQYKDNSYFDFLYKNPVIQSEVTCSLDLTSYSNKGEVYKSIVFNSVRAPNLGSITQTYYDSRNSWLKTPPQGGRMTKKKKKSKEAEKRTQGFEEGLHAKQHGQQFSSTFFSNPL